MTRQSSVFNAPLLRKIGKSGALLYSMPCFAHAVGMEHPFNEGQLSVLEELLAGECLAAKKAKLYSATLFDPTLAAGMERLAKRHAERFLRLAALLAEEEKNG